MFSDNYIYRWDVFAVSEYYNDAVYEDVKAYLEDNMDLFDEYEDNDELIDYLNDELWTDDYVTGNGSGSYTNNREEARGYVLDDSEIVKEALKEFGVPAEEIIDHFFDNDWEYFDVTARCYVLNQEIYRCVNDLRPQD